MACRSSLPAKAATAAESFGDLYKDMGLLAAASIAVVAVAAVLRSLRDQGVLSDRWSFGDECDPD